MEKLPTLGNKSAVPLRTANEIKDLSFDELKQRIHSKLVDKLDLSRVGELEGDVLRREIRTVIEHLCDNEDSPILPRESQAATMSRIA